jgi:uncharacterized protein YndB with AHSA1/START domain
MKNPIVVQTTIRAPMTKVWERWNKPEHILGWAFAETPEGVRIVETFEPEQENTEELQRAGWQAILDNFKQYAGRK